MKQSHVLLIVAAVAVAATAYVVMSRKAAPPPGTLNLSGSDPYDVAARWAFWNQR